MSLGPPAPDLAALRRQLGEAIFETRSADAREREALFVQIKQAVSAGEVFTAAMRRLAPTAKVGTMARWYRRWELHGFAGLFDTHTGPDREAVRAKPKPAAHEQLSLLDSDSGQAPAIRTPGRTRRPVTLLKLPGNKLSVAKHLVALSPAKFTCYHEPFLGSAALFLALHPSAASLSDRNAEFINAYTVVRDSPAAVIEALAQHRNTAEHYYQVRGLLPERLPPVERAARTLYLNRTCFNGLFRVNRHGLFNVPYGKQTHTTFFHPDLIWRVHEALQGVGLFCEDFAACGDRARPGDFVYLDPPYAKGLSTGRNFEYQTGGFGEADQRRVAEVVRLLDQRGCLVMTTNADCELVRELYQGFGMEELRVHRRVGGHTKSRGGTTEIVVRNYSSSREQCTSLL